MNASRSVDEEAAAWVVRLEGGVPSEAERQALAAWTRQSPVHAASLARARASWIALAHLPPHRAKGARPRRRHLVTGAGAALLAAGAAVWLRQGEQQADHRTARGEVRRVGLPDGSQVTLAGASAIGVHYDSTNRGIDLLAGEALFAPVPLDAREARPFIVSAGNGRVRALGTRFIVASRQQGFDVAVLEHSVEVGLDGPGLVRPVVVQQAQGLHYNEAGPGQPFRVDAGRQAAWTEGRLVFDRMALAEVVGVLNRYRPGRIILGSPALAARRVSGVFRTDLAEDALQAIVAELGARSVTLPLGTTVLF